MASSQLTLKLANVGAFARAAKPTGFFASPLSQIASGIGNYWVKGVHNTGLLQDSLWWGMIPGAWAPARTMLTALSVATSGPGQKVQQMIGQGLVGGAAGLGHAAKSVGKGVADAAKSTGKALDKFHDNLYNERVMNQMSKKGIVRSVKVAYNEAFINGVEESIPKIAEQLVEVLGISAESAMKTAEAWIVNAFQEDTVEEKVANWAHAMHAAPHIAHQGMRQQQPRPQYYAQGRGGRTTQNNFAGAPAPASTLSTAAGIGAGGAMGMGVIQSARGNMASNKIFDNLRSGVAKQMGPDASKGDILKRTGQAMQGWVKGQNRRYADAVAAAAKAGGSPQQQAAAVQKAFMGGAKGKHLDNLQNFMKRNALKNSGLRWGLGGLGLWGLSQLM